MPMCFVPMCSHSSKNGCSFYRFPAVTRTKTRWLKRIRRADREPTLNDRVCGCHFLQGKGGGPTLFPWSKMENPSTGQCCTLNDHTYCKAEEVDAQESLPLERVKDQDQDQDTGLEFTRVVVKMEYEVDLEPFGTVPSTLSRPPIYPPAGLSDEVIRMETGLPDMDMFRRVVGLVERFEGNIIYAEGWIGESITLECQVFMTLMKLRQNYTDLHLAQLFCCSRTTVANVVKTMIYLLHKLLFSTMMSTVPSLKKNRQSMPTSSLQSASNCRMIIDCTDIKVVAPKEVDMAELMNSTNSGMHSLKVLIGVAPNGVITYCSPAFMGSTSDRAITAQCGILEHLEEGDMIMANKGFLISGLLPEGASVNIPPNLNQGKSSEREVRAAREVARNRIQVERANAQVKDFRILGMIPVHLRGCATVLVQLCCSLVNLQHLLSNIH